MIRLVTTKRLNKLINLSRETGIRIGRNDLVVEVAQDIRAKVCFDNQAGKGCEHSACYELIDLLNKIGKRIDG